MLNHRLIIGIGELLAALWLDMRDVLGAEATRELFLDWMLIAQVPGSALCASGNVSQAADLGTLVEILSVASDADVSAICSVFEARNIHHPYPSPSVCRPCYADCDRNGVLDTFDFVCFQSAFAAGEPYADCDNNDVFDTFDFVCFQNAFVAGCP